MNKKEIVAALYEERNELRRRIDAIESALIGFGSLSTTTNGDKPRSAPVERAKRVYVRPDQIMQWEKGLLDALRDYNDWIAAKELVELVGNGLQTNGTLYGMLNRLWDSGQIMRNQTGDQPRGRVMWKIAGGE